MITGRFEGGDALVERIKNMPAAVRAALVVTIRRLTIEFQAYVMNTQLTGKVLHNRSGNLRNAIYQHLLLETTAVLGEVGTNLSYGIFWEYGGTIPARTIEPKSARALSFVWNGQRVFFKKVEIPARHVEARSFLNSALKEKKAYHREQIMAAVRGAVRATK